MCFFRKKKAKKEAEKQKEVEAKKIEEVKAEPAKKEEPKKSAPAKKEEPAKQGNVKYHISQNKDDKSEHFKQWRVRKQGSEKTIKYFKTQKEAIDYAKTLAKNANTDIVIHKTDGKIRKQNY